MYDYHAILASVAILLGIVGMFTYIRSILRAQTKPHIFTWLGFFVADCVILLVQFLHGGGFGSLVTLASLFWIFVICLLAVKWGEKHITTSDRIVFGAALCGIVLWVITSEPLAAVVILTVTNTLAAVPTFRKTYRRPNEESMILWSLDVVKFSLGIFALSSITLTTALFPLGIIATNIGLISMVWFRRRGLDRGNGLG